MMRMEKEFSIQYFENQIRQKGLSSEMENTLLYLLKRDWRQIKEMREKFDERRTKMNYIRLKRYFPIFNDTTAKLTKFEDYNNLVYMILVSKLILLKISEFKKRLFDYTEHLRKFLTTSDDKDGENLYKFLIGNGGRRLNEEDMIKELQRWIILLSHEVAPYSRESVAYEKRNISKVGMKTNDAIKCLADFSGRTVPFLRTISKSIKPGDKVLELGLGTGVLSIAAIINGAKSAVGIERNLITVLLAKIIIEYMEENNVIPKDSITILWGDFLKFATEEYKNYRNKKFDVLISENIYTGMFYELQMQGINHVLDANLIKRSKEPDHGIYTYVAKATVIPKALSSMIQPVEVTNYKSRHISETLIDIKKLGAKVKFLAPERIYDQIRFYAKEPLNIVSITKFKIQKDGILNGIDIASTVCMMDGDYIGRNENKFLSNDSILLLNKGIDVKKGDLVVVGLAYNSGDHIKDIILEVRKLNKDGSANKDYDARLNISAYKHNENKRIFLIKNKCKNPINLYQLGDYEVSRSSSFYDGDERTWLVDLDYIDKKPYEV